MTDLITSPPASDTEAALEIARDLIRAGVPIFAAPPCRIGCGVAAHAQAKHHYALPLHWTKTVPAEVNLSRWEPGWALAAIGGFAADFLDVDPRSQGDVTAAELRAAGLWPRTFGRQLTPSGGHHEIITPTGMRKGVLARGVDLQAGVGETREGLGFVYLAPTVGVSKVTGELIPYRWEVTPDLDALTEWRGVDESTHHVVHLMTRKRSTPGVPAQRAAPDTGDDPFATAATLAGGGGGGERSFTPDQAREFIRPYLTSLQAAQVGEVEETANTVAAALSHFVPAFWSADQAYALLTNALSHTAYDGATWRAEKFRPVLDGRRPPADAWKATHRAEPPAPPAVTVETAPGEESLTTLEKLRRMLVGMKDLASRPAPAPLIYGLLNMDTESWLIGAPGSLKSFVVLDMAGHVATGRDWQGHRVRQGRVLYVAAEGAGGMTLRTRGWMQEHGVAEDVTFLPYPVQVKSHDGQWEALVQIARELEPVFIVIDTQARVSVGMEENAATDMGTLIAAIGALRRATGACVLTIHHTGRNGQDARGSNAIDGAQDTELKVVRGEPRSALECKLVQDKQKDMAEGDPSGITLRFRPVDLGADPDTGKPLSTLVMCGQEEVFERAQGMDVNVTRPWLPTFHHRDRWKQTILNALYDLAPEGVGLTKPEVRAILVRDAGMSPKTSSFDDAWKAVLELRDADGHPVVEGVGGARYDLVSLGVLEALKEQHGPRGDAARGSSGEGPDTPDTTPDTTPGSP